MSDTIDARGLSCPQPVLLTLNAVKTAAENEIFVLVDTDTSVENITRAVGKQGWHVTGTQSQADGFKITVTRG
jgi:TusA-related sulfurtransferase